ncbi:MAG: hypothetical protein PVH62_10550, partial [Anaerolineae bacterium]
AQGRVSITTLAAATAQREEVVQVGLAWLAARGHVALLEEVGDETYLAPGDQETTSDLPQIAAELQGLLEETAAYRAHFARADKETLV